MRTRLITGACMFAVLLPLVIIDHFVCEILYAALVVFISSVGTYEYVNGAYLKDKESNHLVLNKYRYIVPIFSGIIAFLCCNATYQASVENNYMYHLLPLLGVIISSFIIMFMMIFTKESNGNDIGHLLTAIIYSGLMLGYAFSLRYFIPSNINNTIFEFTGRRTFLFVYTIVVITDSFAYLVGRKWGKKKLCPDISPNKSVEGAIGGLVFGAIFGVASLYVYNIINTASYIYLVIPVGLVICGIISCAVQIGDLVESKFKRTFDVKDFGKILPGHGGILDRFDSFIFSGTLFYIIAIIFELIIL